MLLVRQWVHVYQLQLLYEVFQKCTVKRKIEESQLINNFDMIVSVLMNSVIYYENSSIKSLLPEKIYSKSTKTVEDNEITK